MNFRTLTSLAVVALVVIVAVNMNRHNIEQAGEIDTPQTDEVNTPLERGTDIDRMPADEIPADDALTIGNGMGTPDFIGEPIPEPTDERTPLAREALEDETGMDEEGQPASPMDDRAESVRTPG